MLVLVMVMVMAGDLVTFSYRGEQTRQYVGTVESTRTWN